MNHDTVVHPNLDSGSMRRASLTAGLALALMVVIAPFGVFGAIGALVTPGDAARTAQDILGSESLFRWGIASLILVVILDIVVAAALLRLFEPVDRSVSIMAAWFRVAYAAVYLVAIVQLVIALGLLDDPAQALRAVNAYDTIWHVGLILFGCPSAVDRLPGLSIRLHAEDLRHPPRDGRSSATSPTGLCSCWCRAPRSASGRSPSSARLR